MMCNETGMMACNDISVVHLTLDGVNGKWRWRRNLCQIDGENSKLRRQSSEFSDVNPVIYDRYLQCHFWMTPYVHNTEWYALICTGLRTVIIDDVTMWYAQVWRDDMHMYDGMQ